jgi:hypothetical protein
MLIDCDTCTARPAACGDCVVTHLLSARPVGAAPPRPSTTELTAGEVAAVAVLSAQGLVPPLRLVTGDAPAVTAHRPDGGVPAERSGGAAASG